MRNLRCIARDVITLQDAPSHSVTCWDVSNNSLICTSSISNGAGASIQLQRIDASGKSNVVTSWDADSADLILCIQYFADTETFCIILSGGNLVLVRETPSPGEEQIEIVGSVDAGLLAARWSPDEELLVLVTKQATCIFMSRDLEPITEATLTAEDANLSKHVNVGWGKKETQFHGKRAKALRDPTMPEYVDEGLTSPFDHGEASISWRGDGQYVAINSREKDTRRIIRVFSRDGTLDSVSEPIDYLESALSWRPAGNLIAAVQRKGSTLQVVFIERNGLRHGDFSLRIDAADVEATTGWASQIALDWNTDSSVLAVAFCDKVQLWTMGNYHYYLKQEIWLSALSVSNPDVRWHPEQPLRLAIASTEQIQNISYIFDVTRGSCTPPSDKGLVLVIDGKKLKITPLRTANIPPPMALHEIEVEETIIDCAVSISSDEFAVLSAAQVSFWKYDALNRKQIPMRLATHALPASLGSPRQILMSNSSRISVLFDNMFVDTQESGIAHFMLSEDGSVDEEYDEMPLSGAASLHRSVGDDCIAVQKSKGQMNNCIRDCLPSSIADLGRYCPWAEVVQVGDSIVAFGLASNGTLYAGKQMLANNCTSFVTTASHLIFTTTNHLLKFVHLVDDRDLDVPADDPETDERCRTIERGAKIITAIPSTYAVVLQMPRGNLETIYPRALVLAGIRKAINERDYKTAFMACRNQRVDMNILHDHDPDAFMANVSLFIEQVKRVDYIDLFLSQLREEDVSQTMYKDTIQKPLPNGPIPTHATNSNITESQGVSKVNGICDAFLTILGRYSKEPTSAPAGMTRPAVLRTSITAHVCKSPADLVGGLQVVSELRRNEANEELAEQAAEHICFLADVNRLYDTALSMYDLDLTLQMAQQSQKDPREYLPYLQKLQDMNEHRRRFTIDHDLGNYSKAIEHLFAMDEFEEIKAYAERRELHRQAIELYKYQTPRLNELMALYAAHLLGRNRYKEAGVAYEFLGVYTSALTAYRSSATYWREALFCAQAVAGTDEDRDVVSLAQDLTEALIESKDYRAAATINLDYLSNIESGIRLLCRAAAYSDALRVAVLRIKDMKTRQTFLADVLDPALLESFATTTEVLADCRSQLAAQIPRLRELRVKKQQDPLAFYGGDPSAVPGAMEQDFPDNISLAATDASTSGGTFMTRYTGRQSLSTVGTNTTRKTSKNRRREERKRARGKKGSVYEEEYLINSIGRLIERINSINEEVGGLVEVLMRRGMRERAVAVETAMLDVVTACQNCLAEVFPGGAATTASQVNAHAPAEALEQEDFRGADGVYAEAMQGVDKIVAPVVKKFERLNL